MYGLFTRRNMITMLMSVELILNSVNINFVAFNKYLYPDKLDGVFFTIFIITIAAAEAAVAIAIIINLYRSHRSIDVEDAAELKYLNHDDYELFSYISTMISTLLPLATFVVTWACLAENILKLLPASLAQLLCLSPHLLSFMHCVQVFFC